eukprot:Amastigsp_a508886_4533.p2 type:complete len:202 gc:universal Amastigsp_a508886_4533:35-640(+)
MASDDVFVIPPLPYAEAALEPLMSAETLRFHYGKHHAGYYTRLNGMIGARAGRSLMDVIRASTDKKVLNNAQQAWNHDFYWAGMAPGGRALAGDSRLAAKITASFGSLEAFLKAFKDEAVALFGSGWTWLVANGDGELAIVNTENAKTPLDVTPLLVCDVWEHAYYIDVRNDRARFVDNWIQLINWEFAAANYEAVLASKL